LILEEKTHKLLIIFPIISDGLTKDYLGLQASVLSFDIHGYNTVAKPVSLIVLYVNHSSTL